MNAQDIAGIRIGLCLDSYVVLFLTGKEIFLFLKHKKVDIFYLILKYQFFFCFFLRNTLD